MEPGVAAPRTELCCIHVLEWQLVASQGPPLIANLREAFRRPWLSVARLLRVLTSSPSDNKVISR